MYTIDSRPVPSFSYNGTRYLSRLDKPVNLLDDQFLELGANQDGVLTLSSSAVAADAEVTGLIEGTSDHLGHAANSVVLSNITNDGDVHILVSKAGNSHTAFLADGSTGDTILNAATGQSVDLYVAGTKEYDFSASTLDMNSNTLTNIGASGNQWTSNGLVHAQSADNIQDAIRVNNLNVGSSAGMRFIVGLADAAGTQGDSDIIYDKTDNTDGSIDTRIRFRLRENGGNNEAVRFLSTGQIEADLGGGSGNVTIFDDWDDALVLQDWAHGSGGLLSPEQLEHNRELLCEAGVMSRKDTGSGYWLAFQPMMRLLAGGIYQTRAFVDANEQRIDALERELGLLKALPEA
jgi:hypothetical protein